MIDAETGGSVKTTRIEQAIETLQDLMTGVQAGLIGGFELALTSAPAPIAFVAGSSRYDVFAVGPGQALWHKYWDSELERLGEPRRHPDLSPGGHLSQVPGGRTSSPAAPTTRCGTWPYIGDGPGSWASLGGLAASGPRRRRPGDRERRRLRRRPGRPAVAAQRHRDGSLGGPGSRPPGPHRCRPTGSSPRHRWSLGANGDYDMFVQGGDYDAVACQLRRGGLVRLDSRSAAPEPPHRRATGRRPAAGIRPPHRRHHLEPDRPAERQLAGQPVDLARRLRPAQGPGALAENNVFTVGTDGFLDHNWLRRVGLAWLGDDQRAQPGRSPTSTPSGPGWARTRPGAPR